MKSLYGAFALVVGLISLVAFIVRLSITLAVVGRRFRQLIADAFSQPPSASDPVLRTPVEIGSESPDSGGYWADRERS